MKFIDHFLEDRKHSLSIEKARLEQLEKEDVDAITISVCRSSMEANRRIINAFEEYGLYLNLIDEKHWLNIMPKLNDAVKRYERRKLSETGKKQKDPAKVIGKHIGHAQKVLDDLGVPPDFEYSEDGKTFTTKDGDIREVAPSAVDRVLLRKLLNKYISDLESKTFRMAHRGKYYGIPPLSKADIEKVLADISKKYFHNSKANGRERKQLKDAI